MGKWFPWIVGGVAVGFLVMNWNRVRVMFAPAPPVAPKKSTAAKTTAIASAIAAFGGILSGGSSSASEGQTVTVGGNTYTFPAGVDPYDSGLFNDMYF